MDQRPFSEVSPGRLVETETDRYGAGNWAFVPDPLPAHFQPSPNVWAVLAEAKESLGLLEGLGRTLPNPDILLMPLQQREALRSSSLEGTHATPEQLMLFDLEEEASDAGGEGRGDAAATREVSNYVAALRHGVTSDLPLCLRLVKEMHHLLMQDVRGEDQRPGEWRIGQVYVGVGRRFTPPPATELEACLDALERSIHHATDVDPLIHAFMIHYQFEAIHPFRDGNGRVGRLLLSLMLLRQCRVMTKPWLYISEAFENHKDEYIDGLFDVSAKNAWDSWIEFCLRCTVEQAAGTIRRCEQLLRLRERFTDAVHRVGGNVRLARIVEDLFSKPYVRVTPLAKRMGVTYPTAKADIDKLVEAGVLRELEGMHPRTFFCPEIMLIGYED